MLEMKHLKILVVLTLLTAARIYAGPNYLGSTGLLRTPDARLIEDGDLRFTLSQTYPYRTYSATFGFFPFLELNGRLTEILDEKSTDPVWEDYGHNKDKAFDFKVLLFKETDFFPALAVGVQDAHGTQLFFAEYAAASKKIGNLDFTIGYGGNLFGNLFKEDDTEVRGLDGIFGGVEWKIRENLSFLLEYDPTEESATGSGKGSSHLNYGMCWKPWRWLSCNYSYQYGEEHSFLVSITYPFGRTLAPQKPDEPFYGPVDWTSLRETLDETPLAERILSIQRYIAEEGFPDAHASISADMKTLYISFENKRYLSHGKAAGRVLRVAAAQTPSDVENICVTLKQQGIPMAEIKVSRADYINYLNGDISEEEIMAKTEIRTEISTKFVWWDGEYSVQKQHPSFSFKLEPLVLETFLNDPSGFFKFRAGPAVKISKQLSQGFSVGSFIKFPLYSNVETNQEPISDRPVRSDAAEYLARTGICVENLFINRFFRHNSRGYLKLGGGWLETQYAGLTAEYLLLFRQGRFALGHELTWAKKRDPDSLLGLKDEPPALTRFLNLYMYAPELDATLSVKLGTFLGGDSGARLELSRDIRGGRVFLWYTKTDTSGFEGDNKGYSDKGIGIVIPVRVFENSDVPGHQRLAIAPWSRDTGQPVSQPYGLFDFVREFTPAYIFRHWNELKE